jgi:hypothetical protein
LFSVAYHVCFLYNLISFKAACAGCGFSLNESIWL